MPTKKDAPSLVQNVLSDLVIGGAMAGLKAAITGDKVYFYDNYPAGMVGAAAGVATGLAYSGNSATAEWEVDKNPEEPELKETYTLKETTGEEKAKIAVTNNITLSPTIQQATYDNLEAMKADTNGNAALKKLPTAAKEGNKSTADKGDYEGADGYSQKAYEKAVKGEPMPVADDAKKAVNQATTKSDGSRISKEYHEWDYCINKSGDWDVIDSYTTASISLTYTGESGATKPTWGDWVDLPDLRELFKIYRRYKRLRGACNGKALWEAQGYTSKINAISNDILNDPNWTSVRDALVAASSKFST